MKEKTIAADDVRLKCKQMTPLSVPGELLAALRVTERTVDGDY